MAQDPDAARRGQNPEAMLGAGQNPVKGPRPGPTGEEKARRGAIDAVPSGPIPSGRPAIMQCPEAR